MLVLLDLSAVLDTVEVDTLIHTLQDHFGVTGSALDWFRSYMIDRYFQVKVKGTSSKWIKLQYGAPQGSVLGPLLFSLYTALIEAILRKHKVRYHKFADDLQIYVFFDPSKPGDRERAISQIEKCIAEVSAWMLINKLELNPSKAEYILVQSKHNLAKYVEFCIKVGDADLKPSASVRNLGVFMDRGNTSESQVNALCKKCTFHLRRIGSIRRFLPSDVLQGIVTALVLSNLDYCNALLSGITAHQLQRLQRIQNWAAQMISGIKLEDHITQILQDLHWLPVNFRISYKLMLYIYKSYIYKSFTIIFNSNAWDKGKTSPTETI